MGLGYFLEDEPIEFADDLHLRGRCERLKRASKENA